MKKKLTVRATLVYSMLLLCASCESKSSNDVKSSSNKVKSSQDEDLRYATVEAGYGFKSCHIGMSLDDLEGKWQSQHNLFPDVFPPESADSKVGYYNVEAGVLLVCMNRTILGVQLLYWEDDSWEEDNFFYANFLGDTKEGIGKSSSIRDVLLVHGKPGTINNTQAYNGELEQVDGMDVTLQYHTRGIYFSFTRNKLRQINVVPKRTQPPYLGAWDDIGDTRELWEMVDEVIRQQAEADTE